MADRTTIEARIADLEASIATGALRVRTGERDVTFRSVEEMRATVTDLRAQLAALDGARRTRVVRPVMRRGI
jgi:hypothetical protein